jgi:hypothetical protein
MGPFTDKFLGRSVIHFPERQSYSDILVNSDALHKFTGYQKFTNWAQMQGLN